MTDTPELERAKLSYNANQAAAAIGVSARTIWKKIATGELAAFKLYGRTLLTRETLQDAIRKARAQEAA